MPGIKKLRKIQLGQESVAGTKVNATAIWRGTGTVDDAREIVLPDEDIGYLSGVNRSYIPKLGAVLNLDATPATFEQLPYLFQAGIASATPTQDGAGTGYVSTFTLPTTSANTIKTFSVEHGDNTQVEYGTYAFAEEIVITGAPGEAVQMASRWRMRNTDRNVVSGSTISFATTGSIIYRSAGWSDFLAGQSITVTGTADNNKTFVVASISSGSLVTTSAVTPTTEASGSTVTMTQVYKAGLSLPTVEEILFSKGTLAIDAVSGTIGATTKSNTFLGMEMTIATGWVAVFTGDGQLYFSFNKSTPPSLICRLTFEYDGTCIDEKNYFRLQTPRKIRLNFPGSTLTTGGTYTTKLFRFDMAGKWTEFSALDERDGNDIVTGTFTAAYDSTAALFGQAVIVNENSSLT
jgi:hypothetical protein